MRSSESRRQVAGSTLQAGKNGAHPSVGGRVNWDRESRGSRRAFAVDAVSRLLLLLLLPPLLLLQLLLLRRPSSSIAVLAQLVLRVCECHSFTD